MVGGSNQNAVGWEIVKLQQQRSDQSLYFAGFVQVPSFLADRVELIKEEDAGLGSDIIEQPPEPLSGFTEVAGDDRVISNDEQWQGKLRSYGLRQGRFAVARRTNKQQPMPGFISMCP